MAMVLVVSFVVVATYAVQEAKNTTPTSPILLPPGSSKVFERPATATEPIHNPAGSQMFVAGLTIVPTCDGQIDAAEWSDANMYDISDTTGQEDGLPDPLGSVLLWLKQDDFGVYFAIRNNVDQTLDEYDQVGLYFDDNYDGCFPAAATNEGNNWLVWSATGPFVQWRYAQDVDCGFPPSYICYGDNFSGDMVWAPSCFGIGIGPTGVVDYEVMIPYGTLDEYLDLTMPPDSLGFFVYCLDNGNGYIQGEWPSQYYPTTWREPCYYGRLICETGEEWPNHKMHFPQLPDLIGWDVNATEPKTLADDWQCSESGLVKDIHFWGSWKNIDGDPTTDDVYTPMPYFRLSIHSNLPVGHPDNPYPYSIPGDLLWLWEGEIAGIPSEPPTMEAWFDPNTGENICNDHVPYWRYDFFFDNAYPMPEPFFQLKDSIYWLDVSALYIQPPYQWGWKSSRDHFEDDAVYMDAGGPWIEMYEPPRCNWFDVYFGPIGMPPEDMGSTNYYGQGWYFYEMYSWWNMWFYNNPFTYDNPKHIWLEFYIDPIYPHSWAEFAINWSTDIWSLEGEPGRPPLPQDGNEDLYIGRYEQPVVEGWNFVDYWIPEYNPEWVSVDFRAEDVVINGWIYHECVQTSMDLAFVITGEECTPHIDTEKKVWNEDLQEWVDSIDMDVCNNVDFWISILNDGTCELTNITAEDFMDASLEFVDASPYPDIINPVPGGTYLEWNFPGPLLPGRTIDINITAHVVGPVCHLDSNYVFVHAAYEPQAIEVYDEDAAYVHATEEPWQNHKMHYPQLPDPEGWDILATMGHVGHPGIVLADDFMCTETGPIDDIHFWGSWLWDAEAPIQGFWLSIHDNIPGPPYSMPGVELWSRYVSDYEMTLEGMGPQGWYDPFEYWWEHPNHNLYYRYDIDSIPEPFFQDSGTIYWLNVMADIGPPGYQGFPEPPLWGWKTSASPHYEDDAVWAIWTPPVYEWIPLTDPITGITLDLSFVITTSGITVTCGDVNNDGIINVGDIVYLVGYLYRGGPAPVPMTCVGDVNNDDIVNVGDIVYLVGYLYRGGAAPSPLCCTPPWAAE